MIVRSVRVLCHSFRYQLFACSWFMHFLVLLKLFCCSSCKWIWMCSHKNQSLSGKMSANVRLMFLLSIPHYSSSFRKFTPLSLFLSLIYRFMFLRLLTFLSDISLFLQISHMNASNQLSLITKLCFIQTINITVTHIHTRARAPAISVFARYVIQK